MALITATNIIRTLSLFHLALAFFLLTSPSTIADQNLVFILGEAMGLPHAPSFTHPSPPTALLAIILALLSLSDLIAVSLAPDVSSQYWAPQAPVRFLFFFALTAYTYVFKPGGFMAKGAGVYRSGVGDELKNSLVFTWGFVEMVCWFWIYVSLRDERRQAVVRAAEKRKAEENML